MSRLKALLAQARVKVPLLDHLLRALSRYSGDQGDRLAAAVTFYWFLSLFPILLIAIAILGYALGSDAQTQVIKATDGYLPPQLGQTIGMVVAKNKGTAGILGLVGTLFSGLGWVDALRQAIRAVWHHAPSKENLVVRKVLDTGLLLGLFGTIGGSVLLTGYITAGTATVLDALGVSTSLPAKLFTQLLGTVVSIGVDAVLFLFLFTLFTGVGAKLRSVVDGALFGAVGFEVLKRLGSYYVARTTSKGEATYGTFAVVVGLLLFLNLMSRIILVSAAFAVTTSYDSDTLPSATADDGSAGEPGAGTSAQPGTPAQPGKPAQPGASAKPDAARPVALEPVPAGPAAVRVTLAAQFASGLLGAAVLGVGLHAARTARRVFSR